MLDHAHLKGIIEALKGIAEIATVLGAGWWFFYTNQFKRRIQFDVDCRIIPIKTNSHEQVAEIDFIFENKGFVEHRLYQLKVSVHSLENEQDLKVKALTSELEFKRQILGCVQIIPHKYGFFFVRPGVRQVITHTIRIPSDVSVIRVTASFDYTKDGKWPHTIRRIFIAGTNISKC